MNLFDLHFHGCAGHKTTAHSIRAYEEMSRFLAAHETSGFLAAFSAAPAVKLRESLEFCAQLRESALPGAMFCGVYLEGPFLKNAGGMNPEFLSEPSVARIKELVSISPGLIRVVTVAPELPGILPVIEYLASEGITVAAGHFSAKPEVLRAAIGCGLSLITHFCNNTEGALNCDYGVYQTDGPFLEILADDRLSVEMICDGVHVDPRLLKTVYRVKGKERFVAVSDGCAASGMPGKILDFPGIDGGMERFEVRNGALYIGGTDRLTGSLLTMDQAVRNLMEFCRIEQTDAEYACGVMPRKTARLN